MLSIGNCKGRVEVWEFWGILLFVNSSGPAFIWEDQGPSSYTRPLYLCEVETGSPVAQFTIGNPGGPVYVWDIQGPSACFRILDPQDHPPECFYKGRPPPACEKCSWSYVYNEIRVPREENEEQRRTEFRYASRHLLRHGGTRH